MTLERAQLLTPFEGDPFADDRCRDAMLAAAEQMHSADHHVEQHGDRVYLVTAIAIGVRERSSAEPTSAPLTLSRGPTR